MLDKHKNSFEKGQIINNYRIISKIGAGGMGEVYLAKDMRLDRKVAMKFLSQEFSRDADKLNRFIHEAKAVSALNHPNILTVHEIGEIDGINYLTTEFIEGETLRELLLQQDSMPFDSILRISLQIAEALEAAHEASVVHRDIKPENIMQRRDGYIKVLDFGIAKLTQPKTVGKEEITLVHSNPGTIRGTVAYMSPEQCRGLPLDSRTDIWSFGVLLYELLTHQLPFTGETATDVILSIVQKDPPALKIVAPNLPDEIYFIVSKLMRKKADERYQSIKDLLSDLRRLKQKLDYQEIGSPISPDELKTLFQRGRGEETAVYAAFDSKGRVSTGSNFSSDNFEWNNLLIDLSPLIGRDAEVAEAAELLGRTNLRLLTITGVGGTGKTKLAGIVANNAREKFADGVYFISLSTIKRADLVLPIIVQTLKIREEHGKPLMEQLREILRDKRILLVLDNFEQITEAASQIGELLSVSPFLKVIVTSRVRLYLSYEQEFPLQPLTVPAQEQLKPSELKENPAVALFIERARSVKSAFALSEENAPAIAEICRRLDGLPLAVELAAVRIKLLTPQAILARLSQSLKLLTGGARDLPERQQTMHSTIQWSYDLLDAEEKKLFSCLAVFAGGFTLAAAEAVTKTANDLSVELLDSVASLVDKSLLTHRETSDGEPRFRMLEVVREFALESLSISNEADQIKRLHAKFYTRMAESAEPELLRGDAAQWLETLDQEHDNLRSALEWSLDCEPQTALRLVAALNTFWTRRGYLSEGIKWTKRAMECNGEKADTLLWAKVYSSVGHLSWRLGYLEEAEAFFQESLSLARLVDNKEWICLSLGGLGSVKTIQGDLIRAKILTEESLAIAREINDKISISFRLNSLGEIARTQEDYQSAHEFYEEALVIAKQESVKMMISILNQNLAAVACLRGDYQAALLFALETLRISEELGDKIAIGYALGTFAALAAAEEKMGKAALLFGTAQAIYDATGFQLYKVDQNFFDRYIAETHAAMSEKAYEATFRKGQMMRMKEAISLARREN